MSTIHFTNSRKKQTAPPYNNPNQQNPRNFFYHSSSKHTNPFQDKAKSSSNFLETKIRGPGRYYTTNSPTVSPRLEFPKHAQFFFWVIKTCTIDSPMFPQFNSKPECEPNSTIAKAAPHKKHQCQAKTILHNRLTENH